MTHRTRHVLMVAYFFPPLGGAGVQRTLKALKYLPAHGRRATVVTTSPSAITAVIAAQPSSASTMRSWPMRRIASDSSVRTPRTPMTSCA